MNEPRGPQPEGRTGADASPPAARGILRRFFEPIHVPRDAPGELTSLAARGNVVFAMRSPGLLDFLYLRWFLRRHALPPLRAVRGLPWFRGWLAGARRTHRAFEEAVAAGGSALVFLGRRPGHDPFEALIRLQRTLPRPVLLVPALLVWSRRAQRLDPSLWDVLFGSPEAPSPLAKAIAFLRSYRRAVFGVGRPLDLRAAIADRASDPDALLARKVRGVLHQHLAREFRTAVGPPLKAPSRVRDTVMRDRSLRATLESVTRETGRPAPAVAAEARRDLAEIASRYHPAFVEVMRAFLSWAFGRLYRSIEVDEDGLARVKRAAAGAPIVLCPSHKSHVDYLVLPLVLFEHGMTTPHIAAGINLAFWPFGALARRGGAFFIRRKVKGDRVYTAVLRGYVKHLLRDRFPQMFFFEGGRSRTGKLLPPRTGLVSMEVDAWLDGAADDVMFVPVAIDYEKLIEASSYARELAGGEKRKENLRALLGAARVLLRRYERVYVQFEEPLSLGAMARERLGGAATSLAVDEAWIGAADRVAEPAADGGAPGRAGADPKRQFVQAVANRIAWGIGRAVTVTPVGLVAAALLSDVRRRLPASEVSRRVELMRYVAAEGGARIARDLGGAPSDPRLPGPVADAARRLAADGLVRVEGAGDEMALEAVDERRPLLDYHRNAIIHRFVAPAIVAAAARSARDPAVAEVRARALWLSRLFKLEFTYRPGAALGEVFEQNLSFLLRIGALARDGERVLPGEQAWALDFLSELVRSYHEAYLLAAETALAVLQSSAADRRTLIREALDRGRGALQTGRIALRESLSKATLENAVEWLVSQGAVAERGGRLHLADADGLRLIVDGIAPHSHG